MLAAVARVRKVPLAASLLPVLVLASLSTAGCSDAPDAGRETVVASSPVLPTEQQPVDATPHPPMPLVASPACGAAGARVLLRLDWTIDHKVPECVDPWAFDVRFGGKRAKLGRVGTTNDGWCAIEAFVPEGAKSSLVNVTSGRDVFETAHPFAVPCR